MSSKSNKTTGRQDAALRVLLGGKTCDQAAQETGIPVRTIYRWMGNPLFRAELLQLQDDSLDHVTRKVGYLVESAVSQMEIIMLDRNIPPGVRLRAAEKITEYHLRLCEMRAVQTRLAELEAVVYGKSD